jgi:hypothetical protein
MAPYGHAVHGISNNQETISKQKEAISPLKQQ